MLRASRVGVVHVALGVFAIALIARAAVVQLWHGKQWAETARREHLAPMPIMASRGTIVDATGAPLVESRELVRLGIAPRDVRDRRGLVRALASAGVPAQWVGRATDRRRVWVEIPTRLLPEDAAPAIAIRGVREEAVSDRIGFGMGGLVSGLEVTLDTILRGDTGRVTVWRDGFGRRFESPAAPRSVIRGGNTVALTINHWLQDICERALTDAVARMQATGGDIVVLDPHDGAVLAMASVRMGQTSPAVTSLTEPFEPGSTLKPFIGAALLSLGRVGPTDVVDTHAGSITINGRTITDTHHAPVMTLRDVIRWSSNVGIVQFASRLSAREEFEALRDVGFGTPTGLPYPAEAGGTLREPARWSRQSAASLAIGYEVAITPLQLVLAYAAIANGGQLLEPALVREIRSSDGAVWYRHQRRVVRRVMTPETAQQLREALIETVEQGTGVQADLSTFAVAGKTGTARRVEGHGRYGTHAYTASFVGLFPARDPQYVILVKIDDPAGVYFGGSTAAPVSKVILEAAIAARDAALDRATLASRDHVSGAQFGPAATPDSGDTRIAVASTKGGEVGDEAPEQVPPVTVSLARGAHDSAASSRADSAVERTVPNVRGLSLRAATHALHLAGFRVQLVDGRPGETSPTAGALARLGTVVRLGRVE